MTRLFDSFFLAGFECSTQRRRDGVRLDLIRATRHDRHAAADYAACAGLGLTTLRDGLRWHLIEPSPGYYDWSSWLPMLAAGREAGVQVIWDLFHYGAPSFHDPLTPGFVDGFARFAAAAARIHVEETGAPPLVCPLNEMSFFAWAVDDGYFPCTGALAGDELKAQLVRSAIVGIEAMRAAVPGCMIVGAEPLIHIAPRDGSRAEGRRAEEERLAQFEAYDMLTGRMAPQLGGRPDLIDVIGLNFYPHNQWYLGGGAIPMGHHEYRPLADLLVEAHARYGKPIFLAETGAEGSARPAWLHYVCQEVREGMARGVDCRGICLYPVTAYPGWDNSRHAEVGLFSVPLSDGRRRVHAPLVEELQRQRRLFDMASS